MDQEKDAIRGVLLIRHGQRKEGGGDVGLESTGRGEEYIRTVVEEEYKTFPFQKIMVAPTRVARETLHAMLRYAKGILWVGKNRPIIEDPRIHYCESDREAWIAIAERLHTAKEERKTITFDDLQRGEQDCIKAGRVEKGFLNREGLRIFLCIAEEVKSVRIDGTLLCIMHSPLIETVLLYLLTTCANQHFQAARQLDTFLLFEPFDGMLLGFRKNEMETIVPMRFAEKVAKRKQAELLDKQAETLMRRR